METYRWYVRGYRYPVFETVKSVVNKKGSERKYFDVAFFYPPQDHYYLEGDKENALLLENESTDPINDETTSWADKYFRSNFYPNPVSTHLFIEYYLERSAPVGICLYSIAKTRFSLSKYITYYIIHDYHIVYNLYL